eukprot:COSAG01_NODE_575_length_15274_cov_83.942603_8_plen_86_part_00
MFVLERPTQHGWAQMQVQMQVQSVLVAVLVLRIIGWIQPLHSTCSNFPRPAAAGTESTDTQSRMCEDALRAEAAQLRSAEQEALV